MTEILYVEIKLNCIGFRIRILLFVVYRLGFMQCVLKGLNYLDRVSLSCSIFERKEARVWMCVCVRLRFFFLTPKTIFISTWICEFSGIGLHSFSIRENVYDELQALFS